MSTKQAERVFTGWHMLAVMVAFFGVIIAVNVFMAVMASRSWTGFVVENSHIAGAEFNAKVAEARAQKALGWNPSLVIKDGRASVLMRDRNGAQVKLNAVTLSFERPVDDREDRTFTLVRGEAESFQGQTPVADGAWFVSLEADAGLEHSFKHKWRVQMSDGNGRMDGGT